MSENSQSKIPYWDEKAESLRVHVCKIQVNSEFFCVRDDKFNPVLMENCPTWSELTFLVIMPENQGLIDLYQANEKLCAVIALDLPRH
jgi:hypothetical protein